jgi:Stress responsive A/B Barrel Domain
MIRHIVGFRLNASASPEHVERIRSELAGLACPGRVAFSMGTDLGLRPGNLDLALVADFIDLAAFRAYDQDPEHNRIRQELIAPVTDRIERIQFEL